MRRYRVNPYLTVLNLQCFNQDNFSGPGQRKKLETGLVTQIVCGTPFNCYQFKNLYNKSKIKIAKCKNRKIKFCNSNYNIDKPLTKFQFKTLKDYIIYKLKIPKINRNRHQCSLPKTIYYSKNTETWK